MNYQTFSNLQFRPLLKNSFLGIHIDLRDTSDKKLPVVFVVITRLPLISRKGSNIQFSPKIRYKMVASRQVEIPFYTGIGQQGGRGISAFAQVIGWTAVPFLCKNIVQLQNAWVLTCWNLLCQKLQMLLVVEKNSRQLRRAWDDKLWENYWVVVARKRVPAESFQQALENKSVIRKETSLKTFLINHAESFSVPTFCGSFRKYWSEIPSNRQCLVVRRTRILSYHLAQGKLHRVLISNGSELLRWFQTDVLGFESESCQGRNYETYNTKEIHNCKKSKKKKGAQKRSESGWEKRRGQRGSISSC